ncbi:MAG: restriction endonuclease subunit S [Candidatus Latescibacteria bacterium]|nr:restriction endonuclease subunit S [Candidatus Latescibacterota bacterium]
MRRFKRYPAYKDSGVEWLGEVPAHWETRKLKFVSTVIMGQSPPSEHYNTSGDGLPFLQGNADFGIEHPVPRIFCPVAPKTVKAGDHLISVRAPVGALNTADQAYGIGRGLCAVRIRPPLTDNRFARWSLRVSLRGLDTVAVGSTYEAVSTEDVSGLTVPLPQTQEQRAIAAFLDRETVKIDAMVAKKERLIDLLKEKRASLITQAVTKGLDPKVPMKDSGVEWIGETPAHWEVQRIKWVARMESGHTPDKKVASYWQGGDIPWVSLADTGQLREVDYIADTAVMTTLDGIAHSSAHILPAGTVVFSRDATIGLCAITRTEMAVSQHFIGWVCGIRLRPEYLLFVLRSMTQELEHLTMGATVRTIGMPDVKSLSTPVPPVLEQEEIVHYIRKHRDRVDSLTAKIHTAIDRLKELRTALISAAVTGKIDVLEEAD